MIRARGAAVAALAGAVAAPGVVTADPSSGVDSALFRPSYDTSGVFSLEGARLPTRRDLSWKMVLGFARSPLDMPVPGIGDTGTDTVLDYTLTLDMAFGFSLGHRVGIGLAAAVYRTDTGGGYGQRGRYRGLAADSSTGLISLRPTTNIDPSGGFQDHGLSGPLDVRAGIKYQFLDQAKLAVTAIGTVVLPFGDDEMFLGDANLVFEPRLALDLRKDRTHATKLVANVGARIRQRTVLQAYDSRSLGGMTPEEAAQVVLDVGSEAFVGAGGMYELSPTFVAAAEAMVFVPLPAATSYGTCRLVDERRCDDLMDSDYFEGGSAGDLTGYATAGINYRVNPHVTASLAGSAGLLGARGDDFRIMVGATWSPQPAGEAKLGRGDTDGDGIPDVSDACPDDSEDKDDYEDDDGCPDIDNDGDGVLDVDDACRDEPEDRDAYQDDDGCPERDNDTDGIPDVADRCPDDAEDFDGYEDDDGCSDEDNDGDGFPDKQDKCPNDPETVNGVDDDDGCPDVRTSTGPVEAADRIDLRGNRIDFVGSSANLTPASKVILGQVGALIRDRSLTIRVEVHVALGTRSRSAAQIRRQKARDKELTRKRAQAILDYLVSQGVPRPQVQAVGLGSDRPLGANPPTDPLNERIDFVKTQQRSP